jgi:hypothetical protein
MSDVRAYCLLDVLAIVQVSGDETEGRFSLVEMLDAALPNSVQVARSLVLPPPPERCHLLPNVPEDRL